MSNGNDVKKKQSKAPQMPEFEESSIVMLPVENIIPYSKNPRKNDDTIPVLMDSIAKFGFNVPIIIDRNNVVVAGHARLISAKRLKIGQVPCIRVNDLTPQQVKAFRLADNKVGEEAKWNEKLLKLEFDKVKDFDFKPFGFEPITVKGLDGGKEGALKDDFILPPFSVINGKAPECAALDVKWSALISPIPVEYPAHLFNVLCRWFTPLDGRVLDPLFKSQTKETICKVMGYEHLTEPPKDGSAIDLLYLDLLKGTFEGQSIPDDVKDVIRDAVNCLGNNRFVVAIVQERRDEHGCLSTIGSELETLLEDCGVGYYNEIIYKTKNLQDVEDNRERFINNRITPPRHMTVMVFYKGIVKGIRADFAAVVNTPDEGVM